MQKQLVIAVMVFKPNDGLDSVFLPNPFILASFLFNKWCHGGICCTFSNFQNLVKTTPFDHVLRMVEFKQSGLSFLRSYTFEDKRRTCWMCQYMCWPAAVWVCCVFGRGTARWALVAVLTLTTVGFCSSLSKLTSSSNRWKSRFSQSCLHSSFFFLPLFFSLITQSSTPWTGALCGEAQTLLELYATQNNLSPFLQDLA